MEDNLRQRSQKKLLRVTMSDGNVICHKSATMTFIEALQSIGSDKFKQITTENCHLPLLSKEIYPRYKEYMKPVADGWYVNIQSDTDQKYMQLVSIKKQLGLDMEIEVGTDFITSDAKVVQKKKKEKNKLLVKFPDGEYVAGDSPVDTFLQTIWKIGIDKIWHKSFEYSGKSLITTTNTYKGQIQIDKNRWLTIPPQTKDKYKMLTYIAAVLRINLEVTII